MTGFGTASDLVDGSRFVVEVRAVNGRYLKCHVRLPEELQGLEARLEEIVTGMLDRGSITVTARLGGGAAVVGGAIDLTRLERYLDQLAPLAERRGLTLSLSDLLALPGVLDGDDDSVREQSAGVLTTLVTTACRDLDAMRLREGETLLADLQSILDDMRTELESIRSRAPEVITAYEARLHQRMSAMLEAVGGSVTQEDLIREVAVFSEKSDIAEELSRLDGHLVQFGELIVAGAGDPVGRTLDFLTQEMLRETNTIGSKCLDGEVSRCTVRLKGAIDRLKEQVQNIL